MTVFEPGPTRGRAIRPELSDSAFRRIADFAHNQFGIQIDLQKKSMIQSRLSKRLRALGQTDFAEYCAMIEGGAAEEREQFISAITTNVTHFFREVHHFEQLRDDVLPPLIETARQGGRVRIWSAGSSTGPEPFSIAATLLALCPEAAALDIRILATDLDRAVLTKAKTGTFDADQAKVPAPHWAKLVFEQPGAADRKQVRADVMALVTFRQLNLNGDWPMRRPFDVIFCRNVAIYFGRAVQQRLWQRFADHLPAGGTLVIGHSERVSGPAADKFDPAGITTYRKRA
ncbi:MAG: protein-glutamate O-methyltransferase [Pseudomonadota bacterium]